jgi:hypothetical protein
LISFIIYLLGPLLELFLQYTVISWINIWVLTASQQVVILYLNYIIINSFHPMSYSVTTFNNQNQNELTTATTTLNENTNNNTNNTNNNNQEEVVEGERTDE